MLNRRNRDKYDGANSGDVCRNALNNDDLLMP